MAVKIKTGMAMAALNITPLLDVIFMLLVFFLVVARFEQEDRELDVQLPSASEAQPLTAAPKELFVNIDKDGQLYVGRRQVARDELDAQLKRAVTDNPVSASVIIRADKRVALEHVVYVMNSCERYGVNYSLTIEGNQ